MKDISGQKFGLLTAIRFIEMDRHNHSVWLFQCECGARVRKVAGHALNGHTRSCGCRTFKLRSDSLRKHGHTTYRHGRSSTYGSWVAAKTRCTNSNAPQYEGYGSRGISMCKRWSDSFAAFLEDMGEKPDGYTIERIDVNGDYEPSNCKWIPAKDQAKNKRNSVFVVFRGKRMAACDAAELLGISTNKCYRWIKNGNVIAALQRHIAGMRGHDPKGMK